MNSLEKELYRTRKTLFQVCQELGLDLDEALTPDIQECSNCSQWLLHRELKPDLDKYPVCKNCMIWYGF